MTEVVLAVSYRPDDMREMIALLEAKYKLKVVISIEETPLGTGAQLAVLGPGKRTQECAHVRMCLLAIQWSSA